ncbi:hypothetical protein Goari_020705 [Gossypium aridum]|uniref:Uncharacterized protein n=1 Tax=Gossypium aridum TaxID=34290 RepID=A0A7J8YNG4_GOSAI|nr:hypothetical protein [Gossypium aridum]
MDITTILHIESQVTMITQCKITERIRYFISISINLINFGGNEDLKHAPSILDLVPQNSDVHMVVPEAQKFRVASIDLELEGKLDQMFLGIVVIGDKAWVPSLGILPSDLFKEEDIETPDKNEGNPIDDVHISTQVGLDIDRDTLTPDRPL